VLFYFKKKGYDIINNLNVHELTESQLLSEDFLSFVLSKKDEYLKARLIEEIKDRAKLLGCKGKAESLISALEKSRKEEEKISLREYIDYGFDLIRREDNSVATTLPNFEDIVENDPHFKDLRYNTLLNAVTNGKTERIDYGLTPTTALPTVIFHAFTEFTTPLCVITPY
jgi:hypothetical protein